MTRNVVELTAEERRELKHRAACYTLAHKDVQRAKLILHAADGLANVEIARRLEMTPEAVGRWRRRFCEQRLEGLKDKPRSGRPRRFPPGGSRRGQGGGLRAALERGRPALALLAD
jgi:hypothetical protein